MDWKPLAAKLAALGLPVLGKAVGTLVGGQIPIFGNMIEGAGENIGAAAAKMIADALGVEPTPEAINTAIETKPTSAVLAQLQTAEAGASARWPALAEIAKAEEETARTQIVTTAESIKQEVLATTELPESKWRTAILIMNGIWRPLFALEWLLECMGFATLLAITLIKNDQFDIDATVKLWPLIGIYMAARFGLIGYHMNLRTREKEAVTDAVTETKPITMDEIKAMLKLHGIKVK